LGLGIRGLNVIIYYMDYILLKFIIVRKYYFTRGSIYLCENVQILLNESIYVLW